MQRPLLWPTPAGACAASSPAPAVRIPHVQEEIVATCMFLNNVPAKLRNRISACSQLLTPAIRRKLRVYSFPACLRFF